MSQRAHGGLVAQRGVELDGGVAGEEQRGRGLLGAAGGRVLAAECLDLGEVARVAARGQRRRRPGLAELLRAAHQQRRHEAHPGHEHRQERGRRRPPHPRGRWPREEDLRIAPVAGAARDQIVSGERAEADAVGLGAAVGDLRQRCRVGGVEAGLCVGRVGDEHAVGGGDGGRLGGGAAWRAGPQAVGLVAAGDADDGVINGRLHEARVKERLLRRLAGVSGKRGDGARVPVGDHGRVGAGAGRVPAAVRGSGRGDGQRGADGERRRQCGAQRAMGWHDALLARLRGGPTRPRARARPQWQGTRGSVRCGAPGSRGW